MFLAGTDPPHDKQRKLYPPIEVISSPAGTDPPRAELAVGAVSPPAGTAPPLTGAVLSPTRTYLQPAETTALPTGLPHHLQEQSDTRIVPPPRGQLHQRENGSTRKYCSSINERKSSRTAGKFRHL
jgi:hypothetical protein